MANKKPSKKRTPPRHKVVYLALSKIKPDPRNARTHSKKQIEALRTAIREYGFTNPILLKPDGTIGAGHGRFAAATAEGLDKVPTITLRDLTHAQWRAYMLADNKLAITGSGWDSDILLEEMKSLQLAEIDLKLTGFTDSELGRLGLEGFGLADGDAAKTGELGGLQYAVIIRCKDEADQLKLLERFQKEGLECETLIS